VPPPCKDISSQKHFSNKPSFSTRGHQQQIVGNITKAVAFRQMAAKFQTLLHFPPIGNVKLALNWLVSSESWTFEGFKVLIVSGCKKCVSFAPF